MDPETREFLDQVACIAQANINSRSHNDISTLTLDEQGAQVIMSAYLELYHQYIEIPRARRAPSSMAYAAAEACCGMRRQLQQRPKVAWSDDEHGLFTLMLAYMFMFKHLYVLRA